MQHTVILGESGSGKSTLLRIISGLAAADSGKISMNGMIASSANRILVAPHLRNIGFVFQDLALWSNLSVLDNIKLVLSSKSISRANVTQQSLAILKMCGINDLVNRKPSEISGGQQQRVALARAIVLNPKYLLLDEPFSGLDLVTKYDLMEQILTLADKQNMTIVIVTHDPFEAVFFAKQALIFNQGKIADAGEFQALLKHSKNQIIVKFRNQLQKIENK